LKSLFTHRRHPEQPSGREGWREADTQHCPCVAADAHIDKMAKKYLGVDKYPYRQPTETRVIYKIQPEHTTMMG